MGAITLLTDFGTRDYFVGAMKGAILSVNPQASVIDITHEIPPQDVSAAAFTLANYYKNFPPKTIHVCVVDPGVGSARRAILLETADYFFLAPDNGLLSFVFDEVGNGENEPPSPSPLSPRGFRVFELTNEKYFAAEVSRTFHGRDVFAPVAAHLSNGIAPESFGNEIDDFVKFENPQPRKISETETQAEIIHIDRFGNLVTNLKTEDLPAEFTLEVNETRIEKHREFYAEAGKGEIFSIAGSAGFLEIVAFRDSAERLLKAKAHQKILLRRAN
ncbi:MAG: SAM-dependent chlorinase/fluorinase [Acidobacteriota bacterium]|nr:SAM-dependent chlorinase/fluorinase [Acidobacteriota bacterium]